METKSIPQPSAKGEITLDICGEQRRLKLTLESINRLETEHDCGIVLLGIRAAKQDFRVKDMAHVFLAGIRGIKPDSMVKLAEVERWIFEEVGLLKAFPIYGNFLLPAVSAGPGRAEPGEAIAQTAST